MDSLRPDYIRAIIVVGVFREKKEKQQPEVKTEQPVQRR